MDKTREPQAGIAKLLEHYAPPPAVIDLVQHTPILLLVGISGAGKDTIKHHLLSTGKYHHIVSHTTRSPRENNGVPERDGVDYHFVNMGQVEVMLKHGEFVEAKLYSNNAYGTSVAEIQAAQHEHKVAVTDLEIQGVAEYKALSPEVLAVFILPPTYDVWLKRLHNRYRNEIDKPDMRRRIERAAEELEHALASDYYVFVVNDDLDETVRLIDRLARDREVVLDDVDEKAMARELLHRIQANL